MLLPRESMNIMGETEEKIYPKQAKIMVQCINKVPTSFLD